MAIAEQLNNLNNDLVVIHNEVSLQDTLIASIITALSNKTAGTANAGFVYTASQVRQIGSYAFYSCAELVGIDALINCVTIDEQAFHGCYNLKEVSLGTVMTTIGQQAFQSCTSLESISLPSSLTSIGTNAFYGCTALSVISYNGTVSGFENLMVEMGTSDPGEAYFTGVPAEYIVCEDGNISLWQ